MQLSNPLSFWKDLVSSPKATLEKEKPGSLMDSAIIVLVVSLISGILNGLSSILYAKADMSALVLSVPIGMVMMLIIFFIGSAILYGLAKILGGKGGFEKHTYLLAAIDTLMIVTAILGLIPVLGGLVGFLLMLYMLYLAILAMQVSHGLDFIKAAIVVLIPVVLLGVLAMILFAAAAVAYLGMGTAAAATG